MSARSLDEDDVRGRPPRRSRPRSKLRPDHADAALAMVTLIDRGRITCAVDGDPAREVVAVKARELGRKAAVVGDRVRIHGDISGAPDTLARLVAIEARSSGLRRTADDADPFERVIVANVDRMGVVVATADPPPRAGLIDRCLVAAYDAGVSPLLVITKADLASPDGLISSYRGLGLEIVATRQGADLGELHRCIDGRTTVLVGHSGVGKSTLVNALVPQAGRATGAVNETTGRGRHVSTSVRALPLTASGWIIDTPGVRSFGLAHVERDRVVSAFADLSPGTQACPRGCSHDEQACALDEWVALGNASTDRLASLRRILRAIDSSDDH